MNKRLRRTPRKAVLIAAGHVASPRLLLKNCVENQILMKNPRVAGGEDVTRAGRIGHGSAPRVTTAGFAPAASRRLNSGIAANQGMADRRQVPLDPMIPDHAE